MARKKRCSFCKQYYETDSKQLVKFCSDNCKTQAIKTSRVKNNLKQQSSVKKSKTKNKRSERKIAKDDAWNAFSIYIRTRDCIRFTGTVTNGKCVTCDRPFEFKQLQAGHFIPGRNNAVLFDERIVYSQCVGCNLQPPFGKGGNYIEYFVFMEKEWGREKIDEFRALSHKIVQYKIHDFKYIEAKYKRKTEALLNALNV